MEIQIDAKGVGYDECLTLAQVNALAAEAEGLSIEQRIRHAAVAQLWRDAAARVMRLN